MIDWWLSGCLPWRLPLPLLLVEKVQNTLGCSFVYHGLKCWFSLIRVGARAIAPPPSCLPAPRFARKTLVPWVWFHHSAAPKSFCAPNDFVNCADEFKSHHGPLMVTLMDVGRFSEKSKHIQIKSWRNLEMFVPSQFQKVCVVKKSKFVAEQS